MREPSTRTCTPALGRLPAHIRPGETLRTPRGVTRRVGTAAVTILLAATAASALPSDPVLALAAAVMAILTGAAAFTGRCFPFITACPTAQPERSADVHD